VTGIETPPSQSICIAALYGDLLLKTLLHDSRGSLSAVCGWMELAIMKGEAVSPGLEQGVMSLSKILTSVKHSSLPPTSKTILISELIEGLPGAKVPTESLHVQACRELFRMVLRIATPDRIEVNDDPLRNRVIIKITGLEPEGVSLASCPDLSRLIALRADPLQQRTLGTALLLPLAWACDGNILRSEMTMVEITLKKR
jgi:hypothetical protein